MSASMSIFMFIPQEHEPELEHEHELEHKHELDNKHEQDENRNTSSDVRLL